MPLFPYDATLNDAFRFFPWTLFPPKDQAID